MNRLRSGAVLLLAALTLGGCAQQSLTGDTYSRREARQVQHVQYAVVDSVRPVVIEGRTDGVVGAGAGAIVGGIAGSTIGGGKGSSITTVLGAVAGGIAGQRIEEATSRRQGQELTLRLDNGELISVVQEVENNQFFRAGDRVRILRSGATMRVSY
ncbi:glycine zipper 2TM domain-containing protein [Marinobacterium sp. D7]|uniref:glycine zipper 2TM domain-containing protein n=1 Tax=Marinobacterium ramblicola TaxID=2849041 RepID=UPI001C2D3D25|nr:glycine zipper 2TM domain-containing protein [Marinobacterium ramblicola]MBV1790577.1 glycine zipper 2TM domain-containing protein [Marinobacterium ramblicola]